MPITFPLQLFHIITIDFIFLILGELDSLLKVTDKFIRKDAFIPGKFTYNVSQWVNALLDRLFIIDWGIPTVIISDRDPKFLSEMWQEFFQRMGAKLLTFTVYHPQIDGISERTNQTMEITIRFFTINYPEINFVLTLLFLQAQLNNSFNTITGLSANKLSYGFNVRETFSSFTAPKNFDLPTQRLKYRQKTADVSAFVNVKTKIYYDSRHMVLLLNARNKVYLKLHHGYEFPSRPNKKVSHQRCGPSPVFKKIKRLAYELEFLIIPYYMENTSRCLRRPIGAITSRRKLLQSPQTHSFSAH